MLGGPEGHEALDALYNSTSGDNWTDNTGWRLSDSDDHYAPCGWFGVTCGSPGLDGVGIGAAEVIWRP